MRLCACVANESIWRMLGTTWRVVRPVSERRGLLRTPLLILQHPWCKKSCSQELEKGLDQKEVKSKWAAKACVVLLLIKIKF